MDKTFEFLELDVRDSGLAVVTLNRPEVLNAFNTRTVIEVKEVFRWAGHENSGVRCIVLTGAGDRAFCSGADLKERGKITEDEWADQHVHFEEAFEAVIFCPVPVICAVNGLAYGGGMEFICAADFTYAAKGATFALTEVKRGIYGAGGGTQLLPRKIGPSRAAEMLLGGLPIDSAKALEWGLVNKVVDGDVLSAAIEAGDNICENGPLAVRQAKKSMRKSFDLPIEQGLLFEREAYFRLIVSEDRKEGVRAFNEKRKPDFVGR